MVGGASPWAVKVKKLGGVSLALTAGIVMGVAAVSWPSGSGAKPTKPTAMRLTTTVGQGPVSSMVTAPGVLAAATTTNLGFRTGNNLKRINVKVGDKVKKGQLLAEEDNNVLRDALAQAEATLANQREQLALLIRDVTVSVDARIDQASDAAVRQAQRNIVNQERADQEAINRARGVLRFDERALALAKAQARADGCYTNNHGSLITAVVSVRSSSLCPADLEVVNAAAQTVYNDRTTVIADENAERVNKGNLVSALLAAVQTLRTNQAAHDIAKRNRPTAIRAQEDLVRQAEAAVALARDTLDFSYVYAPIDGTVTAVTGTVGEFMPGQIAQVPVSPLAPGSRAQIPDVGGPASADLTAGNGGQGVFPLESLRATAPGGGAFIQLGDLDTFQVVVPFAETDITKVQPGAAAKLSFPAIPGLVEDGAVTSVAPAAVNITNKTNYYATILLTDKDPLLKPGMSSNVSVVTQTIKNKALVVPTSAVIDQDGRSYVNVLDPDGTSVRTMFTKGKVGDDNSEVLAGLTEGQKVFLPSTGPLPQPRPSAPNAPAPRPNTTAPTNRKGR